MELLLLGRLPDERADAVEGHLDSCPRCLDLLGRLEVDSVLVRALRGAAAAPAVPADVRELTRRLEQLCPPQPSGIDGEWSADPEVPPALAPAREPDELGRLAHYRVLRVLGAGGMGVVYQAEDTELQRPVALKVLRPRAARDPGARQRFLRGARAMAAIRHDHIAVVHQVGEAGGDGVPAVPFPAMELLEGLCLDARARVNRQPLADLWRSDARGDR
jgi:hypothetical protein